MNDDGFTPGPWSTESTGKGPDGQPYFHMITRDAKIVASTWGGPHIANARLIAAAPDLLAELERVADLVEEDKAERSFRDPAEHEDVMRMRAVIAKAKGGSP